MECNFWCKYCFEKFDQGKMSAEVQHGLLNFIDNHLPGSKVLYVTWFGGEPLLAMEAIEFLTLKIQELCDSHGISYGEANIITNGYLLTKPVVEKLRQLKISKVQDRFNLEEQIRFFYNERSLEHERDCST